jgi:hypothetical protein
MKKSQSITLSIVAAMGMKAGAQLAPPVPVTNAAAQTCEERRELARVAGTRFTENCGHASGAHGTSRGGFGATGKGTSGGG